MYWLRPKRPLRIGAERALALAFVTVPEVGIGVSALDLGLDVVAVRCFDGDREGVGGGESACCVSSVDDGRRRMLYHLLACAQSLQLSCWLLRL